MFDIYILYILIFNIYILYILSVNIYDRLCGHRMLNIEMSFFMICYDGRIFVRKLKLEMVYTFQITSSDCQWDTNTHREIFSESC